MTPRPPRRRVSRASLVPVLAVILLSLAGCGDLDTGPAVEIRADEPVANLHFRAPLPSVESLASQWAPHEGLDAWLARWQESWDRPGPEGVAERREAVEVVSGVLAASVPPSALNEAFRRVDDALRDAEALLGAPLGSPRAPSHESLEPTSPDAERTLQLLEEATPGSPDDPLGGSLHRAAEHRDLAAKSQARGDEAARLLHTLLAADELRGTTAGPLARTLVAQTEAELRRFSRDESYPEVTKARAERLLQGAHEALAVDQPALALQRAWYALGLVRVLNDLDTPRSTPNDR